MISWIQSKSRTEWRKELFDLLDKGRNFSRERGEVAAVCTFAGGLFIALFFKLFVFLVVIALLFVYLIWFLAPESR